MNHGGRTNLRLAALLMVVIAGAACTDEPGPFDARPEPTGPQPRVTQSSRSTDEAPGTTLGRDDLVMAFSGSGKRGGDLFAMYGDGHIDLIDSPTSRVDLYPSFVEPIYQRRGVAVVVERRSLKSNASDLVYISYPRKEIIPLVRGAFPAVDARGGATSRVGFVAQRGGSTLVFSDIGTDFRNEVDLGVAVGRIAFDTEGRYAYVLSDEEAPRLTSHDSTGELGPVEIHSKNEDVFLAMTSDRFDSVVVLRACCTALGYRDAALTDWSLAEIEGGATGEPRRPRDLVPLNDLGLSSNDLMLENLRLAPAGTLDAAVDEDGRITWSIGTERAWILGYITRSWLIDASGEITDLGEIANGGLAINPRFLRSAAP